MLGFNKYENMQYLCKNIVVRSFEFSLVDFFLSSSEIVDHSGIFKKQVCCWSLDHHDHLQELQKHWPDLDCQFRPH